MLSLGHILISDLVAKLFMRSLRGMITPKMFLHEICIITFVRFMHMDLKLLTHKLHIATLAEVEDTSVSALAIHYITCPEFFI